jgi:hypothetical protein
MNELAQAYNAVVVARFNTKSNQSSCNSHLKIYSDYRLKIALTADFRYNLNAKF